MNPRVGALLACLALAACTAGSPSPPPPAPTAVDHVNAALASFILAVDPDGVPALTRK